MPEHRACVGAAAGNPARLTRAEIMRRTPRADDCPWKRDETCRAHHPSGRLRDRCGHAAAGVGLRLGKERDGRVMTEHVRRPRRGQTVTRSRSADRYEH